jgi:hypothetical protein
MAVGLASFLYSPFLVKMPIVQMFGWFLANQALPSELFDSF